MSDSSHHTMETHCFRHAGTALRCLPDFIFHFYIQFQDSWLLLPHDKGLCNVGAGRRSCSEGRKRKESKPWCLGAAIPVGKYTPTVDHIPLPWLELPAGAGHRTQLISGGRFLHPKATFSILDVPIAGRRSTAPPGPCQQGWDKGDSVTRGSDGDSSPSPVRHPHSLPQQGITLWSTLQAPHQDTCPSRGQDLMSHSYFTWSWSGGKFASGLQWRPSEARLELGVRHLPLLKRRKGATKSARSAPLRRNCWSGMILCCWRGNIAGAGAKGGTPLGSAGLMEQCWFDQGGGLMVQ